jgi:ketosteroid isomerase-like protein
MRTAALMILALLYSVPLMPQSSDDKLRSELEAIHAQWFKAFYNGDGAAMDKMEVDNLALIMPFGSIWAKTEPRGSSQPKREDAERTLSDVSVRRFGDTAILTGIVSTKSAKDSSKDATTVVFVRSSGKWKIASAQWTPVTSGS